MNTEESYQNKHTRRLPLQSYLLTHVTVFVLVLVLFYSTLFCSIVFYSQNQIMDVFMA